MGLAVNGYVIFNGPHGPVRGDILAEQPGRVYVLMNDVIRYRCWLDKSRPDVEFHYQERGRPRKHASDAEKQRAYRERVKGNPLRKYSKGKS